MMDEINFLRQKAAVLRTLSYNAPTIAEALRRLADELEAKAAELESRRRSSPDAGKR
jgi:hypothetical protein